MSDTENSSNESEVETSSKIVEPESIDKDTITQTEPAGSDLQSGEPAGQIIPESVPHDDLKNIDQSDDRPLREMPENHNKALAVGIAAILILIFIGGWLYKDEIFAFFRVIFKKEKKKKPDEVQK